MSENAAKVLESGNILTPPFRVSFPSVFRPSKPKGAAAEQEPKYQLTMLFPADADLKAMKIAAQEAAKERFGKSIPKNLRSPFGDQGDQDYDGYEDGCPFVRSSSKQKPGLVDTDNQDIIDESEFYAGCYARATVRAYAYGGKDSGYRAGVGFGLQNVQKLRDGEPFGMTRAKPEDEFEPVEGEESSGAEPASSLFD